MCNALFDDEKTAPPLVPPSPVKHRMGLYSFDEVDVLDMPYGSDSIETGNCQSISYITVQSFVNDHI